MMRTTTQIARKGRHVMNHFLYRLTPPRPTFPAGMTDAEGAIMQEHFAYWSSLVAERKVIAYGPVMDPKGAYGIAVLEAADESQARAIADGDPAARAGAGFAYELYAMPDAQVRP
jgi:uncharacterized protein YciI